jgi:hypothetical protein
MFKGSNPLGYNHEIESSTLINKPIECNEIILTPESISSPFGLSSIAVKFVCLSLK